MVVEYVQIAYGLLTLNLLNIDEDWIQSYPICLWTQYMELCIFEFVYSLWKFDFAHLRLHILPGSRNKEIINI